MRGYWKINRPPFQMLWEKCEECDGKGYIVIEPSGDLIKNRG